MHSPQAASSRQSSDSDPFTALASELRALERRLLELEKRMSAELASVAEDRRDSARNLVHYLAMRQSDLRSLQGRLAEHGLSSLGRAESWVMASVLEVSARVHEALACGGQRSSDRELRRIARGLDSAVTWERARSSLHAHTEQLLGPRPRERHIYVMVTAPSAAEADCAWMTKLLLAGMNVLRVNCAHEGEREWEQTLVALEEARRATGQRCSVVMDLAGPKIRTGPIGGARALVTWKPEKDDLGCLVARARVRIARARPGPVAGGEPRLCLQSKEFDKVRKGDELRLVDARGKKRRLQVVEIGNDALVALGEERAYVLDRARARVYRGKRRVGDVSLLVHGLRPATIDVRPGDRLTLTARCVDGAPPRRDSEGRVVRPGIVRCTLVEAMAKLEAGHRVLFDDGRIQTTVLRGKDRLGDCRLLVSRTHKEGAKLGAEKGINFPDTNLSLPSLTEEDVRALGFVAKHADAVSLSFVRTPADVRALHEHLEGLQVPELGVVLKIETLAGFSNLPRLLLEGLKRPPLGVMIARGDLAVEVGFERMAELQEEILWLCEASHVPAIWATQVLDTLARTGAPSRAEITDASASVGAECVMLNKGPFVHEALKVLSNILQRMERHHDKKRSLYRKLAVSSRTPS